MYVNSLVGSHLPSPPRWRWVLLALLALLVVTCLVAAWLRAWPRAEERFTEDDLPGAKPNGRPAPRLGDALKVLYKKDAPHYRIQVVETMDARLGKCLLLDDQVQACSNDEHRRHETLVHLAAQYLPGGAPKRVLLVGGADCMALREVLKYQTVERVVVVDDDEQLRSVCETHMDVDAHRGDARVTWVFNDSLRAGVERQKALGFDLIVVDLKARPGATATLSDADLFQEARLRLAHDGVLVVAGSTAWPALQTMFADTIVVTFQSDATEQIERAVLGADFDLHAPTRKVTEHALDRHRVHTRYYKPAQHLSHIPWTSAAVHKLAGKAGTAAK